MRAYWYDNLPGDQRLPHDSGRAVDPSYLTRLGVHTYHYPALSSVDALASARCYKNRDEITISPTALGGAAAYDAKLRTFFAEHLHEDEEIRYILDGAGYFDVRGRDDEWVRIELAKGDLLVLPAGIYHRFTPGEGDYTKAMRLFKDDPKWTPLNRGPETDGNEHRKTYLEMRDAAPVAAQ